MRAIFLVLLAAALSIASAGTAQVGAGAPDRPNIVVIVADDLGWANVGFHSPSAVTPNLDRMAKDGTELARFYAYPVCSPTRAALLTGRMPRRWGIVDALNGRDKGLPAGLVTLPGVLRDAGYATALVGKWHLGTGATPQQDGFDHFYGFLGPQIDYAKHVNQRGQPDWQRDGTQLEEPGYSTDLLAAEAVRLIRGRAKDRPFYVQLCFNAPHDPVSAPPDLVEKHKAKGEKAGLLAAAIESLDAGIGRVLQAIDDEKLRDRTLVVFLSDNGGASREGGSNAPLRAAKGTVYEGGIRTDALVRWPGTVPAGAKLEQPIAAQDLLPTLCAVAGAKVPAGTVLDGSDQWPAIRGGKPVARAPFAVAAYDVAVIDGDWKLVAPQQGARQLYNLKDDPSERTDRVAKDPEVAARLGAAMEAILKDVPAAPARGARPRPGAAPGGNAPRRPRST
jgi:arylsulfatase A-like enzyme